MPNTKKIDVQVENHGTLFLFRPLTPKAKKWIEKNVNIEPYMWMGDAFGCEHRRAPDLASGMIKAGLVVR